MEENIQFWRKWLVIFWQFLCQPSHLSLFSTGGRVIDKYRSSMGTDTAQALICGQDWLRVVFNDWKISAEAPDLSENTSNHMDLDADNEDDNEDDNQAADYSE